jgi:hypothetical protein
MGLINDIFALANATFGKLSAALTLTNDFKHEKECEL